MEKGRQYNDSGDNQIPYQIAKWAFVGGLVYAGASLLYHATEVPLPQPAYADATPAIDTIDPTHAATAAATPAPHSNLIHVFVQKGVTNPHVTGIFDQYGEHGVPLRGAILVESQGDSWGPYYEQRDARWGNMLLNGQSGFPMWQEGCYASAFAMVAAHFGVHVNGHLITPADIASNPAYFQHSGPDMFATLGIPGHPEIHEKILYNPSMADIIQVENKGDTVILALHHHATPSQPWETDHFVPVTGYIKRPDGEIDILIRDPDHPHGEDVPLGEYYQTADGWQITAIKDYFT